MYHNSLKLIIHQHDRTVLSVSIYYTEFTSKSPTKLLTGCTKGDTMMNNIQETA